jgi:hypothetical protein
MGAGALAPSLMDDTEILHELDQLHLAAEPDIMSAIDAIDAGMAADAKAIGEGKQPLEEWHRHEPRFMLPDIDENPVEDLPARARHPLLAAVGFVVMMSLGAGAAVVVFHDRVVQIVMRFNGGR